MANQGTRTREQGRAVRVYGVNDLRLDTGAQLLPAPHEAVVKVRYGGICGSDIHYWKDGAVGQNVVRSPMVLGHEIVGVVAAAATDGSGSATGRAVAIDPAASCGACDWCRTGENNLCPHLRYLGSAGQWPHTDGGFVDEIAVPAHRLVPVPQNLDLQRAALAEPAAVAWHALDRAEAVGAKVSGARVLVVGGGPIGLLIAATAIHRGAGHVTVVDLFDHPLKIAGELGVDSALRVSDLDADSRNASADIAFESSGAPAGLVTALQQARRGGLVVAVGQLPQRDLPVPASLIVSGELSITGSLRIGDGLTHALDFLAVAGSTLDPLVTGVVPVEAMLDAFELAAAPDLSTKVLLDFGGLPHNDRTPQSENT